MTTVFDVDYRASSWSSREEAGTEARGAIAWADIVIGNEDECQILTGEQDSVRQVKAALDRGVRLLVRKLGSHGVEAHSPGQVCRAEPSPVDVLCTIGAGDGFAAGFLYGWLEGMPLPECLRCGNSVAAIVISRVSCSDAMPYRVELEKSLHSSAIKTVTR